MHVFFCSYLYCLKVQPRQFQNANTPGEVTMFSVLGTSSGHRVSEKIPMPKPQESNNIRTPVGVSPCHCCGALLFVFCFMFLL